MSCGAPSKQRLGQLALAAAALLCACSQKPEPPIGSAPAERAPPMTTGAAATGAPLFVGRWAASQDACATRGWDLTATSLRSPSALSCELTKARPTPAGYTVYGVCMVGKAAQPTRLIFTLTGPAANRSLTLTGGPFLEPMALAKCPDGLQSASNPAPPSSSAPA
jgi:hypothetical protein